MALTAVNRHMGSVIVAVGRYATISCLIGDIDTTVEQKSRVRCEHVKVCSYTIISEIPSGLDIPDFPRYFKTI